MNDGSITYYLHIHLELHSSYVMERHSIDCFCFSKIHGSFISLPGSLGVL